MARRCALITIALTGCWAAGAEPVRLPLTASPIASPELIITGPARLATGSAGWIPLPEKGARIPGPGQSATFEIADEPVSISWAGERDFTITAGGKTQGLRPITRSYGLQPTAITLTRGRKYTLAFPVGQVGRTPEGTQAAIFYRSGASQNGTLDDEIVELYDGNTDGEYEMAQDSIRVGPPAKPTVFAPLTQHFATSKAVYRIEEVAEDGSSMQCSAYAGKPGKLEVVFASGNSELNLILLSADEQMSAVASASNKVRPPLLLIANEYRVKYGVVSTVPQGHITAVLSPTSVEAIRVDEGETAKLELGAPFKLSFTPTSAAMAFQMEAKGMTLIGKAGETYVNYRWSQPPEVTLQSGATSKRIGKINLQDGLLTDFSGTVPDGMGIARRTVIVTGVIEGLGPVRGEAVLE